MCSASVAMVIYRGKKEATLMTQAIWIFSTPQGALATILLANRKVITL